ncbi:MAG: type II secretory pathway pseudopilin PulG [Phycisphaerales bacterium]|jgi:type II secretory pathway pseudopilin PulG
MQHDSMKSRRAFTLIELVVVNAVLVAGVAVLQPAVNRGRGAAMDVQSRQNLSTLGAGSASFGADNAGMIFAYDTNLSTGIQQATQILSRLTGRPVAAGTPDSLQPLANIPPQRRYQHLVLMDYLGAQLPEPILASPYDRNLIEWQADPIFAQDNTVPYASDDVPASHDRSSNWPAADVRQMWPYGSSYQVVPAAWNPNNDNGNPGSWAPVADTPHLFTIDKGQQRAYPEVAFPSGKVHLSRSSTGPARTSSARRSGSRSRRPGATCSSSTARPAASPRGRPIPAGTRDDPIKNGRRDTRRCTRSRLFLVSRGTGKLTDSR